MFCKIKKKENKRKKEKRKKRVLGCSSLMLNWNVYKMLKLDREFTQLKPESQT